MSTLIRSTGPVANTYVELGEEDALPAMGNVVVSLSRWEKEGEALEQRGLPFGLALPNTVAVQSLDPKLLQASLIKLHFPSFADGRAYSQARLLREACGYRGELRASGAAVVRDQLLGMVRCGIDSFELRSDQSVDSCLQALAEFSAAYQPALDPLPRVRELRRRSG